jgi:senataxin
LFDRALSKGCPSSLLRTQYRMRPEISAWPNETFYEGRLIDGENVTSSVYDRFFHDTVPPISFVDVPGTETKGVDGSLHNGMEVDVAMGIVNAVCKQAQAAKRAAGGAFAPTKVGIITPYAAQRHELTQSAERGRFDPTAMVVVCRTVDGFQGQECDIIIFSAVRTQGMGFLKDDRRLNVAITRAKVCTGTRG